MKQCVTCGHELPDEAAFCPWCETKQAADETAKPPRVWRRKALIAGVTLAVLLLAVAILYAVLRPRVFDAQGAELNYKGYHILLSFSNSGEPRAPSPAETRTIPSRTVYGFPSQLYIYRNNDTENAREDFMAQVAQVTLTTVPREDAAQMEHEMPVYNTDFPDAALSASVYYDSDCGTNDVIWTLYMKNGDRLTLRQSITALAQPEKNYYSTDYDMSTIQELQALLKEIEATEDPSTLVSIYLPAVVYDGGLTLNQRTYFFYGATDGAVTTTFTGPVAVETETPQFADFIGIHFAGQGGTGVYATQSVVLRQCTLTGWDTGAVASNGAWISVLNCTFADNAIGLQYNTANSKLSNREISNCTFTGNGIAVHFAQVPQGILTMSFPGSMFEGNETDILNDAGLAVDADGAVIE